MAVALNGNLRDFGIAEVFQLIGQQRKTGVLDITHAGRSVCLAFDSGSVVWGAPAAKSEDEVLGQRLIRCGFMTSGMLTRMNERAKSSGRGLRALMIEEGVVGPADLESLDSLVTHDTIFDVLRWSEGSFEFTARAVKHDRPREKLLGAEQILMDGLRMVDEWQTFRDAVPTLDTIVERRGDLMQYRQNAHRDGEVHAERLEKIIQFVDGRMKLQRIIDLSRLGLFEATRVIAELMQAGLIAPVDPQIAAATPVSQVESTRNVGQHVVSTVAACIPLLMLLGMVFWIGRVGASGPERIEAFPIKRHVLQDAHVLFEKRRIRHALEAHRYRTGAWPEKLDQLTGADRTSDRRLAGTTTPAYYYVRGENNLVLLAPER